MKQVPSFSIAGFSAGNRRSAFDAVTELPLERLHRRSRAGDDALLRAGSGQTLGGMIIAAAFFAQCVWTNEQQLRAGVVRAWEYTLMRTL
jgi:hypothetical protein